LRSLQKFVPHEMFITKLLLCPMDDGGMAALSGAPTAYTVLTLAGDNTCQLKLLPPQALRSKGGVVVPTLMATSAVALAYAATMSPAVLGLADGNGDGLVDYQDAVAALFQMLGS